MHGLPLVVLLAVFAAAAGAVWVAGIQLSETTDALAARFGFGEALGGLILLAVATNLPEIAITASAAVAGDLGIAVGNILGGIAIQTIVLALLDGVGSRGRPPLLYRAAALSLILEAAAVIAVLSVVIGGHELPESLIVWRISPGAVVITALWLVGLWLVGRAGRGLPWRPADDGEERARAPRPETGTGGRPTRGTRTAVLVFAVAALATLGGGVVLERSGEAVAADVGMGGVLFGATVLAAATSLPEISTGLASVRLGDDALAVSDIFGGNAFLPVLFLLASLVSGRPVLPEAHPTDVYLTALGMLMTLVYVVGIVFRPRRKLAGLGLDSAVVSAVYVVGLVGLVAVAHR